MRSNRALPWCLAGLALLCVAFPAAAFKLSPEGSFIEKKLANRTQDYWQRFYSGIAFKGIHKLGEPVHEEITNRVLGCDGDRDICGAPDYDPDTAYVLAGVRWNDGPPFRFEAGSGNFAGCEVGSTVRLVTFPRCWVNVFKDGEARAANGEVIDAKTAPLLLRSHFGDMQFLHAMASADGETADDIRARIIAWAEFTWRIAMGEISLASIAKDAPVAGVAAFFEGKGWSIQDLFALGNPHIRKPENMAKVAFGSLLRIVEDSFAAAHVDRAMPDGQEKCGGKASDFQMPGRILEFHSYVKPDSQKHGGDDARNAFSAHWSGPKPNVVEVGRVRNGYFVRRAPWDDVKPYVECIFSLSKGVRRSSAGDRYAK